MKCKITNEKIKPFMTFGKMPLANGFIDKKDLLIKKILIQNFPTKWKLVSLKKYHYFS